MYFPSLFAIFRKGKHASTAKTQLDEVVGYFTKIDSALGNMVIKSKPGDTTPDGTSKKNSSSGGKKRKNNVKEPSDASPKKKANVGNNGTLTISQREKRAMELLASYLEERGGMSKAVSLVCTQMFDSPYTPTKLYYIVYTLLYLPFRGERTK